MISTSQSSKLKRMVTSGPGVQMQIATILLLLLAPLMRLSEALALQQGDAHFLQASLQWGKDIVAALDDACSQHSSTQ
eukprot:1584661-Amphidinium_carterae.1